MNTIATTDATDLASFIIYVLWSMVYGLPGLHFPASASVPRAVRVCRGFRNVPRFPIDVEYACQTPRSVPARTVSP